MRVETCVERTDFEGNKSVGETDLLLRGEVEAPTTVSKRSMPPPPRSAPPPSRGEDLIIETPSTITLSLLGTKGAAGAQHDVTNNTNNIKSKFIGSCLAAHTGGSRKVLIIMGVKESTGIALPVASALGF